jgi:release factor glutamine methyltransferase
MTILEALNWGQAQLKSTLHEKTDSEPNPMLESQILLSHILDKPTSYLFAHFEDPLRPDHVDQYQRLIERRMCHEPIAYLLGRRDFYGRTFRVNSFVLIPRPETEHLLDAALRVLTDRSIAVDLGTGSGAIAVSLAAERSEPVIAVDIDDRSLRIAEVNARDHGVDHLVSFLHGNLLEPIMERASHGSEDHMVIAANLPYLRQRQWELIDPDVRDYEPKHALTAGVDGLDVYDALFSQISVHRKRLPRVLDLFLEIDPSQKRGMHMLIGEYFPDATISSQDDLAGMPRLVHVNITR